MKKSQVSMFVIIGIIIVVILGTLILLRIGRQESVFDIERIKAGDARLDQAFLDGYINYCTELTVVEAQKKYGLHIVDSPGPISDYVSENILICLEDFEIFKKQDFKVDYSQPEVSTEITNEVLISEIKFRVRMSKGMTNLRFDRTSYTFHRTNTENIKYGDTTLIFSADRGFVIEIEPGTRAYVDGEEVFEIGLKNLDRNFNGLNNGVLAGMLAFNAFPHGAVFSKPVKLIRYYEDSDVPIFIDERNLKIGYYYDEVGIWIGLPTEVYPEENKLVAYTNHFTVHGMVINCGGEMDPIKYIYTPTLIKQVCDNEGGGCDDWNYCDSEEGDCPHGELYKDSDEIEIDEEFDAILRETWKDIVYDEDNGGNCIKEYTEGRSYTPVNEEGLTECKTDSGSYLIDDFYTEDSFEDFFGVLKCEDNTGEESENKYIAFVSNNDAFSPSELDEGNGFDLDDDYTDLLTSENTKDETILIYEERCIDECPSNICIEVGKSESEPLFVCEKEDYFSYKYATTERDGDTRRIVDFEKKDEMKLGLVGRASYTLVFKNSGDSCIAGEGVGASSSDLNFRKAGWDDDPTNSDYEGNIEGIRTSQKVQIEIVDGTKNLEVDITPLCYKDDDCHIRNAIAFKEGENPTLKFIFEVENSGEKPDACIKGNVEIHFLGTGFIGSYNVLCDKNNEGAIDFVEGACKTCEGIDGKYSWQEYTAYSCLYHNGKCAPSLIGKYYPYIDDDGSINCAICKISDSPKYGIAETQTDCSCITVKQESEQEPEEEQETEPETEAEEVPEQ